MMLTDTIEAREAGTPSYLIGLSQLLQLSPLRVAIST